jgi:acetyl-CoA carboxylase biotin carboxylase subunit
LFKRILIANRGEIAVRILHACQEMGIAAVTVYSDADAGAMHVRLADSAVRIGPAASRESYLIGERIIAAAKETGCEAIHPGYGFLSENAEFAAAVGAAGLTFIGPRPEAIQRMGLKTEALETVRAAGVPTVPGYQAGGTLADYRAACASIGYPVLIKAAAGGGGKGMRVVRAESELEGALEDAQHEAAGAFADDRVFLEKYLEGARHIEFQVFGDAHGNTVHLFERECSIQRRHQKIIEESPSLLLDPELRARMGEAAVNAARSVGYTNAGTVEFIVDAQRNFYFLEMNTRLQVEHPVTEWITGLDLVRLQIRVAAGEPLPFSQSDLSQRGHAIECRVYAEDPSNNFLPAIGPILKSVEPSGPGIRVDTGIATGDAVTIHYDPMIAKLSVYGETREAACERMRWALDHYVILGLTTNIPFLRDVIEHPVFREGKATTGFIPEYLPDWKTPHRDLPDAALILAALMAETGTLAEAPREMSPEGDPFSPWVRTDGFRMGKG